MGNPFRRMGLLIFIFIAAGSGACLAPPTLG
jgi:hypothetical protein